MAPADDLKESENEHNVIIRIIGNTKQRQIQELLTFFSRMNWNGDEGETQQWDAYVINRTLQAPFPTKAVNHGTKALIIEHYKFFSRMNWNGDEGGNPAMGYVRY